MRRVLFVLLLFMPLRAAIGAEALWQVLPPTPAPVAGLEGG